MFKRLLTLAAAFVVTTTIISQWSGERPFAAIDWLPRPGAGNGNGNGSGTGAYSRDTSLAWTAPHPGHYRDWKATFWNPWLHYRPFQQPERDTEPESPRNESTYTGVVIWLTSRNKMHETLGSLESVARYMPMKQDYTFLMLHEGDLDSPHLRKEAMDMFRERADTLESAGEAALARKMRRMTELVDWALIDMHVPNNLAKEGIESLGDIVYKERWPGYHSMCRFYAVNIFWHGRIREFDYYLRMDSDSAFLSPLPYDPFQHAHQRKLVYVYRVPGTDSPNLIHGLNGFITDYAAAAKDERLSTRIEETKLLTTGMASIGGFITYYNNFELVHIPSFRRPDVAQWLRALGDDLPKFYKWRWGDAPLRYATVMMYFKEEQVEVWDEWAYNHGHFTFEEGHIGGYEGGRRPDTY